MNVTLFRDLPTEGWPSMERYADELTSALRDLGCNAQPFVSARPMPRLGGTLGAFANYAWRSIAYPLAARSHQGDLNHIIDHSYAHLIDALDARRTIVTCHDLAPLELDERGRGLSRRLWDHSFRAMLRAAHIIADSTHTRDAILRQSDYRPERITVVPLATSAGFFAPVDASELYALRERYGLIDQRVLLHVGSCVPRKNMESILYALADLHDLDCKFVQIGGRFSSIQIDLIYRLSLRSHVVQVASVPEQILRTWYQASDVFVFPSLYEGFGLPVIEAMASGTPVVCADATSLLEVAGDAALLIDPRDPHKLADAIRAVLTDPALAADRRQHSLARARAFTWERCARETLAVYGRLADHVQ